MLKRKLPLLYLRNKYAKCFINTLLVEKEIQNIFVGSFWICLNNIFIVKEGALFLNVVNMDNGLKFLEFQD